MMGTRAPCDSARAAGVANSQLCCKYPWTNLRSCDASEPVSARFTQALSSTRSLNRLSRRASLELPMPPVAHGSRRRWRLMQATTVRLPYDVLAVVLLVSAGRRCPAVLSGKAPAIAQREGKNGY